MADAEARQSWVGSIVIDCTDLSRMIAFWQAALGYRPREPPAEDGVVLVDPAGEGPNVSLYLGREPPLRDYRLHVDLYAADPAAEVERLRGLGATVVEPGTPGHDFVTLADPDGNPFDVVDKRGWAYGRRR